MQVSEQSELNNQSQRPQLTPVVPPRPPAPSPVMEPRFPLSEAGQLPLTPPPGDDSSGSEDSVPPPFVPSPVSPEELEAVATRMGLRLVRAVPGDPLGAVAAGGSTGDGVDPPPLQPLDSSEPSDPPGTGAALPGAGWAARGGGSYPPPPPPSDPGNNNDDHGHGRGGPPARNGGGPADPPPPPPSDPSDHGDGANPPPPAPSDSGSQADEDRATMLTLMKFQLQLMEQQQIAAKERESAAASWAPKMAKPDTLTRKKVETSCGEAVIAWMEAVEYYSKHAGGGLDAGDIGFQSLDSELKAMVRGFCNPQARQANGLNSLEAIAKEILSIVVGDPGMPALKVLITTEQRESGQGVRAFEDWIRKNQSLLLLTRSKHLPPSVVRGYVSEDFRKLKLITCCKPSLRSGLLPRAANEAPAGMGAWDIPLGRLREILCDLESEAKLIQSAGHFNQMSTGDAPRTGDYGRPRGSTSNHIQVLRTRNSLLFRSLSEEQKDRARRFKSSIPQDIKNKMSRGQIAGDWAGKIAQAGHCKRCGDYGCCPDDHRDSSLAKLQRQIEASRQ